MQRNSIIGPRKIHLDISQVGKTEIWEVPTAAPTQYLSHGYLRYIGKFTPQLPNYFIDKYTKPGDLIVDPMCGSGTTLIEALRLNRKAVGLDINDVALLTSKVVTTFLSSPELEKSISAFSSFAADLKPGNQGNKKITEPLREVLHYFSNDALSELLQIQSYIDKISNPATRDFFQLALLSILRSVSKANIKKMNTEIDDEKVVKPVLPTFLSQLEQMSAANKICVESGLKKSSRSIKVVAGFAKNTLLKANVANLVVLHPPYLSGTAFSETAQLQLAWLNVSHKDLRKKELAMRGSYFHVTNGLQKYLVGWNHILTEAYRVLKPGGYCACVIGDGSIAFTRIPMAPITVEFAKDAGFEVVKIARNLLNHNTGRTLNKKMKFQEVIILRKTDAKKD